MLSIIGYIISSFIFLLLAYPLISTLLSFLFKRKIRQELSDNIHFACVITAYKSFKITKPLIRSIQEQGYRNFHIYVVADQCDDLEDHHEEHLTILSPPPLNSKVKSMKYAIDNFNQEHSHVLIFDPDNLAAKNLLEVLNSFHTHGFKAVQGRRTAKNLDTKYSAMDAMGEIYHNFAEKKVNFDLGSSATIAGSGMSIELNLFKEYFEFDPIKKNIDQVIPGEDKVLQSFLVLEGHRIAYAPDAIIYDEKIISGSQVKRQRTRWINAYFENIPLAIKLLFLGITKFDLNRFLFGINTLYPPLFLIVLSSFLFGSIFAFLHLPSFLIIVVGLFAFGLNFILVLLISKADWKIWKALFSIPLFMMNQILALMNLKKSKQDFLVTEKKENADVEKIDHH